MPTFHGSLNQKERFVSILSVINFTNYPNKIFYKIYIFRLNGIKYRKKIYFSAKLEPIKPATPQSEFPNLFISEFWAFIGLH